jgi:hypothetical protein
MSLIAELKRRSVFKVGAADLVIAAALARINVVDGLAAEICK